MKRHERLRQLTAVEKVVTAPSETKRLARAVAAIMPRDRARRNGAARDRT
jgi:hypothetical protein